MLWVSVFFPFPNTVMLRGKRKRGASRVGEKKTDPIGWIVMMMFYSGASESSSQGVYDGVANSYPNPHMVLEHSVIQSSKLITPSCS